LVVGGEKERKKEGRNEREAERERKRERDARDASINRRK